MQEKEAYNKIIECIFHFMDKNRENLPVTSIDITIALLYVLYGYHKQYKVIDTDRDSIYFAANDPLLNSIFTEVNLRGTPQYMRDLYKELSSVSYKDFEEVYASVIYHVVDNMASNNGRQGEFLTPIQITELIAYFIQKYNCKSVFDPFCGTASIVLFLNNYGTTFFGQEINELTALFARINLEAYEGVDESIICTDSIRQWPDIHFDAIVTCPPFDSKKLNWQYVFKNRKDVQCDYLEEFFFTNSFGINSANLVVSLEPLAFCYSPKYKKIRQYLTDNNLLDTIILLPENLLYGTSVPCALIVCRKGRYSKEKIRFVNAESFFKGESVRYRVLDSEGLITSLDCNDDKVCTYVSVGNIATYNYNIVPSLYFNWNPKIEEGQTVVSIGDLISVVEGARLTPPANTNNVRNDIFRNSFIDVILNANKVKNNLSNQTTTAFKSYDHPAIGDHYLLVLEIPGSGRKYYLHTNEEGFSCVRVVKVMKINENLVTPEYLVYLFINDPVLKKSIGSITDYLNYKLVIDSIDAQKELITKLKAEHAAKIQQEYEADKKRLGVKQNISDLEHLLQTTQANIDSMIYDLQELYPEDKKYHSLIKGVKDNVEYMKRVIRFSNTTISSDMFNFKEHDIDEFMKDYCDAWRNFSGNYFNLELRSNLGDSNKVVFDKTYLKLMLDSILTNVERHGFNKHRSGENQVEVSLSLEKYEEKAYVVLRVANNGEPFKEGFTINDYKTRGRYSAKTGRSGLGGYHVYQIAKGHNGFLYLDSNKIWNVIVEVLLPIENVELDILPVYEHECI